jgi:hypothetical protein
MITILSLSNWEWLGAGAAVCALVILIVWLARRYDGGE